MDRSDDEVLPFGCLSEAEAESMHVLITGAAGMVGRKFVERLGSDPGALDRPVTQLTLVDVVAPAAPASIAALSKTVVGDFSEPGVAASLIAERPDLIVHLAAIVSGEAEADFEKGYRINLDGTRLLFEAIRLEGARSPEYRPRVIVASSIAVFGAPFPDRIDDEFLCAPLTSYGTQKTIGELLLSDYTRRGFLDGVSLRLPTLVIRPGLPNRAASSFFSGILREPLAGKEAVLPVDESVRHWFASPRAAIGFLVHAARLDLDKVGPRRALTMPGLSATVAEEIDALRAVAGEATVRLIRREPDETIQRIVAGWPRDFDASRALALGFTADRDLETVIRAYVEDEGIAIG
jgi:D-erythronate 2-dehydrogenase